MKEIEIIIYEEDVSEPHKHIAREDETLEQVLANLRPRGVLVGEFFFFEGEVEFDPKHHVGGHGHHRSFHARKHRHHKEVTVSINGNDRKTHAGKNSVEHLRKIGEVPADEVLSEFKHGAYVDLNDDGHVEIHGGEIFTSHVKTGTSS